MALMIKSADDSLKEIFIQWVYRHTHAHTLVTDTERFAITFWKGKKSSKGLNFNKMWRKTLQGVLIVESFAEDDKKAQYTNFKHIFI